MVKSSFLELSSIISILILIFFNSSLLNSRLFMIELIVLKVYSDLFFSKILFLLCVTKLTDVQVLIIISKDFIGLVIFVSPNGMEIFFLLKIERF